MRFLQTEWHRHERDRNAWEIERAEMKSRIGRLEGENRTSKRKYETLGKHIKLLENALRKERETVKKLREGGNVQGEETESAEKLKEREKAKEGVKAGEGRAKRMSSSFFTLGRQMIRVWMTNSCL